MSEIFSTDLDDLGRERRLFSLLSCFKKATNVIAADWAWYDHKWHAPKIYKSVEELEILLVEDRAIEYFDLLG